MPTLQKKRDFKSLLERLHDPFQLRVFLAAIALAIGYLGIYMPLSSRIDAAARNLSTLKRRNDLAQEIDHLRTELASFESRLPKDTDTNEWVQYVLEGLRKTPLKLNTLDSADPQQVGPYEAVVLHLELEGTFRDLDSFLQWLELNERLFRVDSARIAPLRDDTQKLGMQVTLMGLKG
jgi:Tfp pilus assembly protein PilO